MPTFTIPLTPGGAIVRATITPAHDDKSEGRELSVRGMLDTGADLTFIDWSVVQLLDLKPITRGRINSLTTGPKPVWANIYRINVRIAAPGADGQGYCVPRGIIAVGGDLFRAWVDGHQAVFGRNVLEYCQFVFNGVLRTFTLTYGGRDVQRQAETPAGYYGA